MNSTCQIHKGFDPSYILIIKQCSQGSHAIIAITSVSMIVQEHCDHPQNYRLRCRSYPVKLVLNIYHKHLLQPLLQVAPMCIVLLLYSMPLLPELHQLHVLELLKALICSLRSCCDLGCGMFVLKAVKNPKPCGSCDTHVLKSFLIFIRNGFCHSSIQWYT